MKFLAVWLIMIIASLEAHKRSHPGSSNDPNPQKRNRIEPVSGIPPAVPPQPLSRPAQSIVRDQVMAPSAPSSSNLQTRLQFQFDDEERKKRVHQFKKFNMLLLKGQEPAVFLNYDENFFLDLPFIDCVLPSMRAGKKHFVPAFIHKVLLPSWYGKRTADSDAWFVDEQVIISHSREDFYPAMVDYLRLLFFASLFEISWPITELSLKQSKVPPLLRFLKNYFGLGIESFISPSADRNCGLGVEPVPEIIMIAAQWGFDTKKIIDNIKIRYQMNKRSLSREADESFQAFLAIFGDKPALPKLNPSSIASVYWTLKPKFTLEPSDYGGMKIVQQKGLAWRKVYEPNSTCDRTKYYEIKQALIARRHLIADPLSIFIFPRVTISYEGGENDEKQTVKKEEKKSSYAKAIELFDRAFDFEPERFTVIN